MGIQKFISRKLNQTAVYWANPVEDGYGGSTYDAPVEIACRWEEMQQIIVEKNGEQNLSRAVVYTIIDVKEEELLWLGTLEELLSSSGESTGEIVLGDVEDLYVIKRFEKSPALNSATKFIRKAYLTPFLT